MNYAWEVLLAADEENLDRNRLTFLPAANASPYVEVSFTDINTVALDAPQIEVNPLYRFETIFSKMFAPDFREYESVRKLFFDIVMHYMAETDLRSGLHKQEYYYHFLAEELQAGVFGEKAAEAIILFDNKQQHRLISGLMGLYKAGHHKEIFTGLFKEIYPYGIIYEGKDRAETMFLYLGKKETEEEWKRIRFLTDTFLPLNEDVEVFFDRHFGIMDVEETMALDHILLI